MDTMNREKTKFLLFSCSQGDLTRENFQELGSVLIAMFLACKGGGFWSSAEYLRGAASVFFLFFNTQRQNNNVSSVIKMSSSSSSSSSCPSSSTSAGNTVTGKWVTIKRLINDPSFTTPRPFVPVNGGLVTTISGDEKCAYPKTLLLKALAEAGAIPVCYKTDFSYSPSDIKDFFPAVNAFNETIKLAEKHRDDEVDGKMMGADHLLMTLEAQAALGDRAIAVMLNFGDAAPQGRLADDLKHALETVAPKVFFCIKQALNRETYGGRRWSRENPFDIQKAGLIAAWDPHIAANYLGVLLNAYAQGPKAGLSHVFSRKNTIFISSGIRDCYTILEMIAVLIVVLTQLTDYQYCVYSHYYGVPNTINCTNRRRNYHLKYSPVPHGLFVPAPPIIALNRDTKAMAALPSPPSPVVDLAAPVQERHNSFDDDILMNVKREEDFWPEPHYPDAPSVSEEPIDDDCLDLRCTERIDYDAPPMQDSQAPSTPILVSDDDDEPYLRGGPDGPYDETQIIRSDSEEACVDEMNAHFTKHYYGPNNRDWRCHSTYAKRTGPWIPKHAIPRHALSLGDKPVSAATPAPAYIGVCDIEFK